MPERYQVEGHQLLESKEVMEVWYCGGVLNPFHSLGRATIGLMMS